MIGESMPPCGPARHPQNPSMVTRIQMLFSIGVIFIAACLSYSNLITRNPQGDFTHMIKWDLVDFGYPVAIFNSDCLRDSVFPLWNPYIYGGKPHVSNPQVCLFHPLNLLLAILKGYSLELLQVQLFVTFFIAGVFMYCCLRSFCLSVAASLVGAISFLGCGFFVGNAEHFTLVNTLAVFPLALATVNKLIESPGRLTCCRGALVIPILAVCGYPSMLVLSLCMLFIFGIVKIWLVDRGLRRGLMAKETLYLVAFFAMGTAAAAFLLIPAFENAFLSVRSSGAPIESIRANSLPPRYLLSMPYPFVALWQFTPIRTEITLRNCSIGLLGFFLAVYHLVYSTSRLRFAFLPLLLINLMMMLGTNIPAYNALIEYVPGIKHVRHPALDFRAFFLFFMCLLAGFGAQDIMRAGKDLFRKSIPLFAVYLVPALVAHAYIKTHYGVNLAASVITSSPFMLLSVSLLFVTLLLGSRMRGQWLCIFMVSLCIIDVSYWVRTNFTTVADPADHEQWARVKMMEGTRSRCVHAHADFKRRSDRYPVSIEANYAMILKYFTDSGYDPLILKYYDELVKSPNSKMITDNFRIMPLCAARLLPDERSVVSAINSGADVGTIALINRKDIQDRHLLEKIENLRGKSRQRFAGTIVDYEPNVISYDIETDTPCIVLFNEIYYPGWRLRCNGEDLPLFRVNHAFRATYLESGKYHLTMSFFPDSLKAGIVLSAIAGACIFMGLLTRPKRTPIACPP